MWRYLSNGEPPRKKAKSGEIQSAERFKQYDKQTRQRNFSRRGRKTTRVGNGSGWYLTMKWSLCFAVRAGLLQRLIKTKRGRLLSALINSNLRTSKRTNCQSRTFFLKLALTTKTNLSLTHRQACACSNSRQLNAKKVTKLIRNAHAVAKRCAPFTHYELMCK